MPLGDVEKPGDKQALEKNMADAKQAMSSGSGPAVSKAASDYKLYKNMYDGRYGAKQPTPKTAAPAPTPKVPSYKKGGMVKKTGLAKLHSGEKVIRKQDVKRTVKAVRKYGGKKA
jgi:hypothetical protein